MHQENAIANTIVQAASIQLLERYKWMNEP